MKEKEKKGLSVVWVFFVEQIGIAKVSPGVSLILTLACTQLCANLFLLYVSILYNCRFKMAQV